MSKEILGQEPAFPLTETSELYSISTGMSKRFYAACAAMQGLLANPNIKRPHPNDGQIKEQLKAFAIVSYEYADELLKQENNV